MKKIMLLGDSNTGKTTTLNLICKQLLNKGATFFESRKQLEGDQADFCCILLHNEKKTAIFSLGDYSNKITCAMFFYEIMECDYLIIACNSSFSRPIKKMDKASDIIISKKEATDFDNERCANEILNSLI